MKKVFAALLVLVLLSLSLAAFAENGVNFGLKMETYPLMYETESIDDLISALDDGAVAVACITENETDYYVFITKTDDKYLYAFNPNNSKMQRIALSDAEALGLTYFYVFNNLNK